ncbi:S-layer homology domain-containing protein [Paenibacillus sp. SAF-054]|uniref:S-layer homology domain-containing protein n=1 Tax=unclassified Paenibacillus TaxID=185978 RepID=UPI003F7F72EB
MASVILLGAAQTSEALAASREASFTDVPKKHWSHEYVAWAAGNRIITGYTDGTFHPDGAVKPNEFVAMLIRTYQPADFKQNAGAKNWAEPYLAYWQKLGWELPSSKSGLTRGEAAILMINAAGKEMPLQNAVEYLLASGISEGKEDGTAAGFKPGDPLTRAEAITFLKRFKEFNAKLHVKPLQDTFLYENPTYSFTLRLPKSWEGEYEVKQTSFPDAETVNLDFVHTLNKEYGGVVFTVSIVSPKQYAQMVEDGVVRMTKLGASGQQVFTLVLPGDVQFDPNDHYRAAEYQSMVDAIPAVRSSFKLRLCKVVVKLNGCLESV